MKVNKRAHALFSVFTADDEYAPMIVVPARDADHAIDRAKMVRAAFPSMQLGPPARACQAEPARDLGWCGIGVMSEAVLAAIEKDVTSRSGSVGPSSSFVRLRSRIGSAR